MAFRTRRRTTDSIASLEEDEYGGRADLHRGNHGRDPYAEEGEEENPNNQRRVVDASGQVIKRNLYRLSLPEHARRGDFARVKEMIEKESVDPNQQNVGCTALHYAAFYNHLPIVQYLLSLPNVDLNPKNLSGITPFQWAVERNHKQVVEYMLEKAAERHVDLANTCNGKGETALHKVALTGDVEMARLLVEKGGGDINAETILEDNENSVLQIAATKGHLHFVSYLLSLTQEEIVQTPTEPDSESITGIRKVKSRLSRQQQQQQGSTSHPSLVSITTNTLIEETRPPKKVMRVKINAKNTRGWTALHKACIGNHLSVVKMLVERGADVNSQDKSGRTVLHWSVFWGYMEMTHYLIRLSYSSPLTPVVASESGEAAAAFSSSSFSSSSSSAASSAPSSISLTSSLSSTSSSSSSRMKLDLKDACGYTAEQIAKNKGRKTIGRWLRMAMEGEELEDYEPLVEEGGDEEQEASKRTKGRRKRKQRKGSKDEAGQKKKQRKSRTTQQSRRKTGEEEEEPDKDEENEHGALTVETRAEEEEEEGQSVHRSTSSPQQTLKRGRQRKTPATTARTKGTATKRRSTRGQKRGSTEEGDESQTVVASDSQLTPAESQMTTTTVLEEGAFDSVPLLMQQQQLQQT